MVMSESQLQESVAAYLRVHYPEVIFHSDFGSGVKLTPGQAMRQKRMNGGRRAWPDIFIAQPVHKNMAGAGTLGINCYGLFLELKREGTRLKKQNGDWASPHIAEQAEMLKKLRARRYATAFAVGYDDAIRAIDNYLSGEELGGEL